MRILFAGDWHGNSRHALEIIDIALERNCDIIIVVGDFGYWEHEPDGIAYLDNLNSYLYALQIIFIDGNHDKTSLLLQTYQHYTNGFSVVRDNIFYAPRGYRWTWDGVRFAAFGGAYSVDKQYRLVLEKAKSKKIAESNKYRMSGQQKSIDTSGTLWFPEEEMTDDDMENFLTDTSPVDIILAHDKPFASNPQWNKKDLPECWPNQRRLQRAVNTLKPKLYIHGHLHYRYTDRILCGDDKYTRVEGLSTEPYGWDYRIGKYQLSDSYFILDTEKFKTLGVDYLNDQ